MYVVFGAVCTLVFSTVLTHEYSTADNKQKKKTHWCYYENKQQNAFQYYVKPRKLKTMDLKQYNIRLTL